MNYPLISEYIEAIKSAEDNFKELNYLRPVLDDDGLPVMTSGNFAVVFKMENRRKRRLYAVKCFTKHQKMRTESYQLISEELDKISSSYIPFMRFYDKELFVDTNQTDLTEFPVLLMEWVEGVPLDKYIRENIDDDFKLKMITFRFSQLAEWLIVQPFAHGDLKPDNILIHDDGTLTLVDFDGMFVPAMKGQDSREVGSPDFSHPLRTERTFDQHIDDFSLITILLSLKLLSLDPTLLLRYGAIDRLLLSRTDYQDISKCSLIKETFPSQDVEINRLINLLVASLTEGNVKLDEADVRVNHEMNMFSTVVNDDDYNYENYYWDKDNVIYSNDGKRILGCNDATNHEYSVSNGCVTICDYAFAGMCQMLEHIELPEGLIAIGIEAFSTCYIQSIVLPRTVKVIGDYAFSYNPFLCYIFIPKSVEYIGKSIFDKCEDNFSIYIEPGTRSKFEKLLPEYAEKLKEGMFY